jgi:hypothetical protein
MAARMARPGVQLLGDTSMPDPDMHLLLASVGTSNCQAVAPLHVARPQHQQLTCPPPPPHTHTHTLPIPAATHAPALMPACVCVSHCCSIFYVEFVTYASLSACDEVVEVMEAVGASERVLELLAAPPADQVGELTRGRGWGVWLAHLVQDGTQYASHGHLIW